MKQLPLYSPGPGTPPAELLEQDFIVFFSGGKDSTAMVLYLLELGVPKDRIHLHHHDVDGHGMQLFDWPCTPSYCQSFADALGLKIFFSHRNGGILREILRENEGLQPVTFQPESGKYTELPSREGSSTRRKFPAVAADLKTRWCSAVVKIDVGSRVIANSPMYDEGSFVVCTGERRQESANRAKYLEVEPHRTDSKLRKVTSWRPIIDWSERDVWEIMERWKIQPHPAYMLGWSRCSCQLCIFGSNNTWASIAELSPEKIGFIADLEKKLDHTLYKGITITEKVEKGVSFITPENKARWAAEALGQFTSPIFVDSWVVPQGAYSTEGSGSF